MHPVCDRREGGWPAVVSAEGHGFGKMWVDPVVVGARRESKFDATVSPGGWFYLVLVPVRDVRGMCL